MTSYGIPEGSIIVTVIKWILADLKIPTFELAVLKVCVMLIQEQLKLKHGSFIMGTSCNKYEKLKQHTSS